MIIREIRDNRRAVAGPGYTVPELPARYVRRKGLEQRLEAAAVSGLVVVAAPAGSGKTLLLASWARNRGAPTGWLTLEPGDGEAHRFWGRVLTAIQVSCDLPPDSVLAKMQPPPVEDQRFVRLLVEGCDELPVPGVLVLDDLHLLTGTPAMTSLAAAIGTGLWRLPLVLSTRSDPVIPLQRLRLEGRVAEFRASDLSFQPSDAARLLAAHDVDVPLEHIAALVDKTEGWAAGLRLAALSLQGSSDAVATIRELAGDQRTVADYFTEEVLAAQEPAMTEFLLDTCIVGRVSSDLADALTGRHDGREMLALLERENLFVIAMDDRREWYRYHLLFGDLLRHRLRSLDRAHADELHKRAADWFARHGDVLEAASHLRAASDWISLSRLVIRSAGAELLGGNRSALETIVEDLPDALVYGHPEAAAAAAVAAYARYDGQACSAHVRRSRALLGTLDPPDARVTEAVLSTLEAFVAWLDSDVAGEVNAAERAGRLLDALTPAELPALRSYRIGVDAVAGMGLLWSGDFRRAGQVFATVLEMLAPDEAMSPVLHLRGARAVVAAFGGRLREASAEVDSALELSEASGWSFLPLVAATHLADAQVRLLEADSQGCVEAIARGTACLRGPIDRHVEVALVLVEARLLVDGCEPAAARKRLDVLKQNLNGWRMPPFLEQWLDIVDSLVAMADGDAPGAIASLSTGAWPTPVERPYAQRVVVLARAQLAINRPGECLETLMPLLADPPEDHGPGAEAFLLAALAHDRLREDAQAQTALGRSLDIAAPEGIVRPYVVLGERVLALLRTYLRTADAHAPFVQRLVARLEGVPGNPSVAPLAEPLTNREQSVLMLLPTMMTNGEIAEELHISVNTVKVHLKGIFRKLDVDSRRHAVTRARALGLVGGGGTLPASS